MFMQNYTADIQLQNIYFYNKDRNITFENFLI